MTPHEEHRARHVELHANFDELLADYLRWNRGKMPSNTSMLELIVWAHEQTINPTEGEPIHSNAVCIDCGEHVGVPHEHVCARPRDRAITVTRIPGEHAEINLQFRWNPKDKAEAERIGEALGLCLKVLFTSEEAAEFMRQFEEAGKEARQP
jgi:hypothetical protein